jgi:hypothetical protein
MIYAYDVVAEGTLADVSAFLNGVEAGEIETLALDRIEVKALPTPTGTPTPAPKTPTPTPRPRWSATATPSPAPSPLPGPTATAMPWLYSASTVVRVHVRLADGRVAPTRVSPQARLEQLKPLLEQARQAGDWERAISLLLAMRQIGAVDPALNDMLVEAYIKEGQRRLAAAQYEQAAANFYEALALRPDSYEAQAGLHLLQSSIPTPTPTDTPIPTLTPIPTFGPSPTPSPTRSQFRFTAQISKGLSPYGCNWSGLVGVVYDLERKPLAGYLVHVSGDAGIDQTVAAGSSQFKSAPGYGDSAWDVPINAAGSVAGIWRVQLYQPGTNKAVSDSYEIRLDGTCGGSFVFIEFTQNH